MPTPDATVPRWSDLFGIDPTFTGAPLPLSTFAVHDEDHGETVAIRHDCGWAQEWSWRERATLAALLDAAMNHLREVHGLNAAEGDTATPPRFGTALDPEGYDLAEAVERHECRPAYKSHPNHCAHCYYPWPCPTVALYRRLISND